MISVLFDGPAFRGESAVGRWLVRQVQDALAQRPLSDRLFARCSASGECPTLSWAPDGKPNFPPGVFADNQSLLGWERSYHIPCALIGLAWAACDALPEKDSRGHFLLSLLSGIEPGADLSQKVGLFAAAAVIAAKRAIPVAVECNGCVYPRKLSKAVNRAFDRSANWFYFSFRRTSRFVPDRLWEWIHRAAYKSAMEAVVRALSHEVCTSHTLLRAILIELGNAMIAARKIRDACAEDRLANMDAASKIEGTYLAYVCDFVNALAGLLELVELVEVVEDLVGLQLADPGAANADTASNPLVNIASVLHWVVVGAHYDPMPAATVMLAEEAAA